MADPEHGPTKLAEDTFIEVLFKAPAVKQSYPTRARGKSHHSSHFTNHISKAPATKRENTKEEQSRRASILDDEMFQGRCLR